MATNGNDYLTGSGSNDTINGLDGNDTILGFNGNDLLLGSRGIDYLYGHNGNDTLDGGGDFDRMYGGRGNDRYYVNHRSDMVIERAGEGIDHVYANVSYTLPEYSEVERLSLTGTAYRGQGNSLDNIIFGNSSRNYLDGRAGDDRIYALGGDDNVRGGKGNDTIFGASGEDTLTGVHVVGNPGQGEIDVLYGQADSDTFALGNVNDVYYDDGNTSGSGFLRGWNDYAIIADYKVGEDTIQLNDDVGYRFRYQSVSGVGSNAKDTVIAFVDSYGQNEVIGVVRDTMINFADIDLV